MRLKYDKTKEMRRLGPMSAILQRKSDSFFTNLQINHHLIVIMCLKIEGHHLINLIKIIIIILFFIVSQKDHCNQYDRMYFHILSF